MSYSYLQEQGEVSSAQSFSDIEPFVLSRLKNTQERSYSKDSGTESSLGFRSGETSKPLMGNLGEASWILSPEDFLAKTFLQQEKELESRANAQGFGAKWSGWFAKYDQDLYLWKIPQCSLLEDYIEFSGTWPNWGTMRDGACWELTTRVLPTNESEFGFWPTPDANMGKRGTQADWKPIRPSGQPAQYPINQFLRDKYHKLGKPCPKLMEWLMGWPISWTDLKPLAMDKFQRWLRLHGQS
jgi:hypothetical protein